MNRTVISNPLGSWVVIWPPSTAAGRRWPLQRLIRLDAAAQIVRNRILNPDIGRMAERMMHEYEDGPLTYYATTMARSDDVTVYGCRHGTTRLAPVATAEFARGMITDRGASLQLPGEDHPAYTGLHISRADVRRKLRELRAVHLQGA